MLVRMPEPDFVTLLTPRANAKNNLTIMHPKVVLQVMCQSYLQKRTAFLFPVMLSSEFDAYPK